MVTNWRKSSFSGVGNCVEVNFHKASNCESSWCVEVGYCTEHGDVHVRNSKDPQGVWLRFTADEWKAFTDGVKAGEFE